MKTKPHEMHDLRPCHGDGALMVTSATQKPNPSAHGEYERGVDPWHRDAFPAEFKDQAPRQENPRAEGWYEIDWCGNVINFIPDGTPIAAATIERVDIVVVAAR